MLIPRMKINNNNNKTVTSYVGSETPNLMCCHLCVIYKKQNSSLYLYIYIRKITCWRNNIKPHTPSQNTNKLTLTLFTITTPDRWPTGAQTTHPYTHKENTQNFSGKYSDFWESVTDPCLLKCFNLFCF
jgi:hypothetical protein